MQSGAAPSGSPRSVLVAGSGSDTVPQWQESGYTVARLDIDPRAEPDIVASMTDVGDVGPFDVVYCSHALEHLYPHEVPKALSEFYRVLKPGGVCIILVPDLEGVPATDEVLPGASCTGLHLYYGDARLIPEFPAMAHHCGFVAATLRQVMEAAGFTVKTDRMSYYNLMGIGVKGA
jgi:SAM-dependent methyltransferase